MKTKMCPKCEEFRLRTKKELKDNKCNMCKNKYYRY